MSALTTFDFDVFLSHASEDKGEVRAFARSLENASLKVWLDEEQLPPGFDPKDAIPPALKASRHVLIWVTEAWLRKSWTQWELKLFAEALKSRDRRVIPVLREPWSNEVFGPYLTPQVAIPPERDEHERLWLAVCGVRGEAPGRLDTWAVRGQELAASEGYAAEVVAEHIKDSLPEDIEEFLNASVSRHRTIELAGFESRVRAPIRLQDLYVPLHAMLDRDPYRDEICFPNAQAAKEHVVARGMQRELLLSEAFEHAKRLGRNNVVLLGDPGSGKTTHLRRILLKIAHDGAASLGLEEGTVPVFLPLRNLRELDHGLDTFIERELSGPFHSVPEGFGERLRKYGRVLYLLDGLDEVRSAEERAKVAHWIDDACTANTRSTFMVTCRYAGYTGGAHLSEEFLEVHLRPLDDEQVDEFVRRWFSIVETSLVDDPKERAAAQRKAEARAGELMAELRKPQFQEAARVYELTHNPLLLTTICLVHRDTRRLPDRRVDLYDQCVNVLLERWNDAKKLPAKFPAKQARALLQPVARWLHDEEGRTRATAAELAGPLQEAMETTELETEPEAFLTSIRDESGLLTGWSADEYGFMHLGFQEYLAAKEIRSREILEPGPFGTLAHHFGDSWWQEVILLMLALDDPPLFDRFMREVVRRPEFPQWAQSRMMDLCMREAAGRSARPFVEVLTGPVATARQDHALAAAQVLARAMPKALEGLDERLREHPAEAVRQWWIERQEQQARGGEVIVASRGGVELVRIPGGRFWMGSPEDEEGRNVYSDEYVKRLGFHPESPRHEVELDSFYLAKTPVTNAQYGEFLKANPDAPKPKYWADRQYNQADQPVVGVSWKDAQRYCKWAGLRLPTEVQWEYACRAGTATRYYSGNSEEDLARVGWYDENSGLDLKAVGQKEPNAFGLYDMHGNVWEWCRDNHRPYTTSPRSGDGLRHEPVGDADRVVRGGGWIVTADLARSAVRDRLGPGVRLYVVGFRPAQGHP